MDIFYNWRMVYRFAREREDYSDYASGRVFYGAPGRPVFPVRLGREIFQRCRAIGGWGRPVVLYDPCCGSGYLLSTLAYLHGEAIAEVIGSDVDEGALAVAERNLSLLTLAGLDRRMAAIREMAAAYGKGSHEEALVSAEKFREQLLKRKRPMGTGLFVAEATDGERIYGMIGRRVEMVIADVPYGWRSGWQGKAAGEGMTPVQGMLEGVRPVLVAGAVVAVAADKGQKIQHEAYRRVERFQVGKRQVVLLQVGE
jgi:23S rRNA (guanine2535-N1)-methyltransferase